MSKILITGYSGFLGSHILTNLSQKGHTIIKLGRNHNADIICDLSKEKFKFIDFDYVIHVAGKAHVHPKSKEEIEEFYDVNYIGTKNLIASISKVNIKSLIFISTVAVYGKETGELIDESYPLLGESPYALSKIKAEKEVIAFGKRSKTNTVILRLPLITGDKPVGNLKNIILAIRRNYYFRIGKGDARRSIVSANDVAEVIPELFDIDGVYNYSDCKHPKISDIDVVIAKKYNKKIRTLPFSFLRKVSVLGEIIPFIPFNKSKFEKLTNTLTFSNKKILNKIKFKPINGISDII
jgi:nucleoside-diphosphate-sugar epimerase